MKNVNALFGMIDHRNVETITMCLLKRDLWKAGIAIAGMVLFLLLMTWIPLSAASAHEETSGLATPGTVTVQATPTEDATVTALNKEKIAQEVQQLKEQNDPDLFVWLRMNASLLLSTLVVVIGGLIGLWRWLGDRQNEREKQVGDRFQAAVTGLGDEKEGTQISAAILLRTFLHRGYEEFYALTFALVVAQLRLPRTPNPPKNPNAPLPLTALSRALIVVFKEAYPPALTEIMRYGKEGPESLDATGIQLDYAYLRKANLKYVRMPQASLRAAELSDADLSYADLSGADLRGANFGGDADRRSTWHAKGMYAANLILANLSKADLSGADLSGTDLTGADLSEANLSRADLIEANLSGAKLKYANLSGANLRYANLSGANLEDALFLEKTNLHGVKGLDNKQREACKAKGAIVDEDPATNSSQSTVAPSSPQQSNDTQALSTPSAQGSSADPDPDGSTAPPSSSQPSPES